MEAGGNHELKGFSFDLRQPQGSHWYQPQPDSLGIGPLKGHNTYLLMADSLDRSGGIGFRCVADL